MIFWRKIVIFSHEIPQTFSRLPPLGAIFLSAPHLAWNPGSAPVNYLKWLRKWKGNIVKTLTLWRRAPKIKVPKNVDNMYNSDEYIKYRGKKPNINTGQDSGKHYKNFLSASAIELSLFSILVNSTAISATPVNSYVIFYPFRSSLNSYFSYFLILLTSDCKNLSSMESHYFHHLSVLY
jgi:hypothetical protein